MVAITKVALLAATASAAVQVKRDYPAVTNDLTTLNSYVTVLSSRVVAYTGGVSAALPVQSAEGNVEDQISKTSTDVQNTASVTSAQASTIISYFQNTLVGNIKNTLNALIAKKSQFNAAGLGGTVRGDLSSLSSESNALATNLIAKAPAAQKPSASAISSTVISLFNSAISAYGN